MTDTGTVSRLQNTTWEEDQGIDCTVVILYSTLFCWFFVFLFVILFVLSFL